MPDRLNSLLVSTYAAAAVVEIGAPLILAVWIARRHRVRWRYWFVGVLVFLVFQGVTRIPAMVYVQSRPAVQHALETPVLLWLFLLFAAVTAGLFEEGGRWLAFRYVVPEGERSRRTALMLGAGHGGLESIGVGLVTTGALLAYLAVTLLPADRLGPLAAQAGTIKQQFAGLRGWEPLMGGWERLGALAVQIGLTMMVWRAFATGRRWWWYALGAHTLVDFTTVGLMRVGIRAWGRNPALVATELLVTLYALLAIWFVRRTGNALNPAGGDGIVSA